MSKLNTVNVVEIIENLVCAVHVFENKKDAERCFEEILTEHGVENGQSFVEDGEYEDDNGYVVQIISSS